jgi:Leucine-rich repeat (LRR) protein
MKEAIIAFVVVVVIGAIGYLQFFQNSSSGTNSQNGTPDSAQEPAASNSHTIDLSNKGLSVVPKDILNNASATALNVSGNTLTGALPAEIRLLSNLEVLNASNNRLTGIPAEIGQMRKLKTVNFANNAISGLPLEIGNLSNLEVLDLRGNPQVSDYDISLIRSKIPNAKILVD